MENINFLKPNEFRYAKITIRKCGRPFFDKIAVNLMGITKDSMFRIAKGSREKCIFLFPTQDNANSLRIHQIGNSFGLNEVTMFRKLGFVKGERYIISKEVYKNEPIFKILL